MVFSSRGRARLLAAICLAWVSSLPLSLLAGPAHIGFDDALKFILGADSSAAATLILRLRLFRAITGLICGGCLGVAGVVLQSVLRNPLADPFTLGIAQGAACGASLAIALGGSLAFLSGFPHSILVAFFSFSGAILALALALVLGKSRDPFRKEQIILAGVAVAAFMGALVALIKALNEESVASIVFWLMGSLQQRGWNSTPFLICACLPCLFVVCLNWRKLDVLLLGEDQAASLGIKPRLTRDLSLGAASCMTAACVSVCGVIGFVGLVVPHIARLIFGPGHASLLAVSFFGGGLFLLLADCVARIALDNGQELPVGVVTSLVGGPFFAWLVWKR